jgi:hypothetical protein
MGCVGKQRGRLSGNAVDDLSHNESGIEESPDREGAPKALRRVTTAAMAAVIVWMVIMRAVRIVTWTVHRSTTSLADGTSEIRTREIWLN